MNGAHRRLDVLMLSPFGLTRTRYRNQTDISNSLLTINLLLLPTIKGFDIPSSTDNGDELSSGELA